MYKFEQAVTPFVSLAVGLTLLVLLYVVSPGGT
jgi:hypothetical protein